MNVEKKLVIIGIILYIFGREIESGAKKLISLKLAKSATISTKWSTICKQPSSHTQITRNGNNWLIAIDGTNEFDGGRMGHDTKVALAPGQKAQIEFLGGRISYNTHGGHSDTPWSNFNYKYVKKNLGESVRYDIPFAGNSILIILKAGKKERIFKFTKKLVTIQNPFSVNAAIYLFYNGKEYYLQDGKIEDAFKWIGCDGSLMFFKIMLR